MARAVRLSLALGAAASSPAVNIGEYFGSSGKSRSGGIVHRPTPTPREAGLSAHFAALGASTSNDKEAEAAEKTAAVGREMAEAAAAAGRGGEYRYGGEHSAVDPVGKHSAVATATAAAKARGELLSLLSDPLRLLKDAPVAAAAGVAVAAAVAAVAGAMLRRRGATEEEGTALIAGTTAV